MRNRIFCVINIQAVVSIKVYKYAREAEIHVA